jgi:putative spermidine/putrescine transport system ATP-binding protein
MIFNRPKTPYVARFMGGQNVLTGIVEGHAGGLVRLKSQGGSTFEAVADGVAPAMGQPMSIAIRRDHVRLHKQASDSAGKGINEIAGTVTAIEYQGSYVKVTLDIGSGHFVANVSDRHYASDKVVPGDRAVASWKAADVHTLSEVDTGAAADFDLDASN